MKCPVCDNVNTAMVCPECRFDYSKDYGKYPTFGAVGRVPSASGLRRELEKKRKHVESVSGQKITPVSVKPAPPVSAKKTPAPPVTAKQPTSPKLTSPVPVKKKRNLIRILLAAALLLAGIVWGFVYLIYIPSLVNTSTQLATNYLAVDIVPYQSNDHWDQDDEARIYSVFGSEYKREEIKSVTILDSQESVPTDAWDVSLLKDGSVLAWVEPNGELYDLYIAAEGAINASAACKDLFAGYANAEKINLGSSFYTGDAVDMSRMFFGCFSLKNLTLSSLDTENVTDMSFMFCYCQSLENISFGDFDTGNVQSMRSMFSWCRSVNNLNLRGFNTTNVIDMKEMFYYCDSLKYLDISEFDTMNVQDMTDMFFNCPAGDEYQHLLN